MSKTHTTTDVLRWLAEDPEARIHSQEGGYVLQRPGSEDLIVEDAEFDQLSAQRTEREDAGPDVSHNQKRWTDSGGFVNSKQGGETRAEMR
jgi:hypothetical protein